MNRKGSAEFVAILIILAVVIIGGIFWYYEKKMPVPISNAPSAPSNSENSDAVMGHPYIVTQPNSPPSINPNAGSGNVGNEITLYAAHGTIFLSSGESVYFDGSPIHTPATIVNWDGPFTGLVFTIPTNAPLGPHQIVVEDTRGKSNTSVYTVISLNQAPLIGSISPTSGPIGTMVTLHGANFEPGVYGGTDYIQVYFGSTSMKGTLSPDRTTITFTVITSTLMNVNTHLRSPVISPGTYPIWVQTPSVSNQVTFQVTE